MTQTLTPAITAIDYFSAKLNFEMTPYSLKNHRDKGTKEYVVLDVRTAEDFAKGHIPGALSIPLMDLPAKLATLPKDKTIVTYCGNITCALAPKAALKLAQAGFKVMELFGGFATWTEKGFPVQK